MIKLIIFDIDGVLIDSFQSNLNYFRQVFSAGGYKKLPTANWYKKHFHFTMPETILKFAGNISVAEQQKLISLGKKYYNSREDFKLAPYSKQVIKSLSKKYKLAIATGRMKDGVQAYLNASGLKSYFSEIAYLGKYKNAKPDPECLKLILKKLKFKPDEVVFVGDSAHADFGAANALNIKFIYFNKTKFSKAIASTTNFRAIPKIISTII